MKPGIKRIVNILTENSGVSLIEVLAAVTVLGIIVIPFSSLFMQTFKMSTDSNLKSIASQTAVKYMESYKNDDSIPEVIIDESGESWVRLPSNDDYVQDPSSNLYVFRELDLVDNHQYSTDESRISSTLGLYPPQTLYKITVMVCSTDDPSKEIVSVTGLKRGKQ